MSVNLEVIRLIAIDPGDVHMGVVYGIGTDISVALEMGPGELFAHLETLGEGEMIDQVVCESFQLYEDKMAQQVGSEMLTCQHVGIIKYICAWHGIPLAMQPAMIKKATARILKSKKIKSKAKGNRHVKDAELHYWHWLLKEGQK